MYMGVQLNGVISNNASIPSKGIGPKDQGPKTDNEFFKEPIKPASPRKDTSSFLSGKSPSLTPYAQHLMKTLQMQMAWTGGGSTTGGPKPPGSQIVAG